MRVLDPRVTNPVYLFHHRIAQKIGVNVYGTSILTVGSVAPLGASLFIDTIFSLFTLLGVAGGVSYSRYLRHTAQKQRLTELVSIKNAVSSDYHYALDKIIADVFHCKRDHEVFDGVKNYFHYNEKAYNRMAAKSAVLTAGHSCEYCGERILAARELKKQCESAALIDNSSLDELRSIINVKRSGIEEMKKLEARMEEIAADVERALEAPVKRRSIR